MRNLPHCPHAYVVPQGETEEEINDSLRGSVSGKDAIVIGRINEEGWHVGDELAKQLLTFVSKSS